MCARLVRRERCVFVRTLISRFFESFWGIFFMLWPLCILLKPIPRHGNALAREDLFLGRPPGQLHTFATGLLTPEGFKTAEPGSDTLVTNTRGKKEEGGKCCNRHSNHADLRNGFHPRGTQNSHLFFKQREAMQNSCGRYTFRPQMIMPL